MGSEATPVAFIDALLELTAEFRRVLAPHGSIAIELGDTYTGSAGAGGDYNEDGLRAGQRKATGSGKLARFADDRGKPTTMRDTTFSGANTSTGGGNGWPLAKSLAMVPHAYATSLAYGWNVLNRHADDSPAGRWRVRNMIIWARPNPPVGALGDKVRPATSYITVACTSAKRWFDLDAVRTPFSPNSGTTSEPVHFASSGLTPHGDKTHGNATRSTGVVMNTHDGAPPLDWWEDDDPTGHATFIQPTQPYPGAHYATWPPKLAQRLIEMMCPLRVCTVCGEPSRRIVDVTRDNAADDSTRIAKAETYRRNAHNHAPEIGWQMTHTTLGWTDCGHNQWRTGLVLDPFAGSGTTLAVAQGCGRDAIGIELYPHNADLIADRCGMFLEIV
jgi:DNA modification methylase